MKFITYLYYNKIREEFFFVNYGKGLNTLQSKNLTSAFFSDRHWMMKDSILVDIFEEVTDNNKKGKL